MSKKIPMTHAERSILISLIGEKLVDLTDDELHGLYDQVVKILDKRNSDCGYAAGR